MSKCPKCGASLLLAAGYWKCCRCKHCIPYPTEADDLREQLVEAGKLIYRISSAALRNYMNIHVVPIGLPRALTRPLGIGCVLPTSHSAEPGAALK